MKPQTTIFGYWPSLSILFLLVLALPVTPANAGGSEKFCSNTTSKAFKACRLESREDFNIGQAKCLNVLDQAARGVCETLADEAFLDNRESCREVKQARQEICAMLGEARYDPRIDPALFVDPLTIGTTTAINPYLPLIPGLVKIFEAEDERVTVTVTHATRQIMGVTAIVVSDVVEQDGELVEVTDDWFAQDVFGNVWYLGEHVLNYEDGVIVDLDGSFEAGIDYARAGIVMPGNPEVGAVYRQEWYLDEAEDLAEVISLQASESSDAVDCNGVCLQVREWTPLEADSNEFKFFAPGVGAILAYHTDEPDQREQLVEIIFPE